MARDGSGTYSRVEADYVVGTTIDQSQVNAELNDMAAALTQSLSKDGQTTPTANQPMGTFKHTGVADGTAKTDYASLGQVAKGTVLYAADTGSADAYAIAPSPGITANVVGFRAVWKVTNANLTTTPTLAVNSLTAGTIVWPDGSALVAGDLPANAIVETAIASLASTTPTWHLQTVAVPSVRASGTQTVAGNKTFSGSITFSGGGSHTTIKQTFTNTLALAVRPQGRLTLATGVPVMISAQTSKATIYYTPYQGNLIPLYDGTDFVLFSFAELSNDTTASSTGSAGPAAVTTNSNYDLFVWSNSGTPTLTRGPLWTSDTGRGTGAGTTELQMVNGIWTNKVAITNGPAANRGTYVGTIRTDGSSQANWQPGAVAANGTAAILGVWNAYNRTEVRGLVADSTDSWSYATATVRPANNSSTMRVSFVVGLQEDFVQAEYDANMANDTNSTGGGAAGVGYDSTTAFSGVYQQNINGGTNGTVMNGTGNYAAQPLGFHYLQALEMGTGAGTQTWYGDKAGALQSGLTYHGRF